MLRPGGSHRLGRRLTQLYLGLVLYGVSVALMVRAGLGLNPWGVFHQGLARQTGWSLGVITILVAGAVLLLWIPLRQQPGIGTISNVVVIGVAIDASLVLLPEPHASPVRWAVLLAGILGNGLASACYIGAGLGPGPRDGLMTGWVGRYGGSVRAVRTTLEVTVLAIGWLLGGVVGAGTVLYAVGVGPLIQRSLPVLTVSRRG
ncbi:hypothetical protein E4P43_15285 [Blastococcus sp. TF02A-35]|nr:hypothetical protein E4P43_15285 [Blastococcus sp. TF02A_35]